MARKRKAGAPEISAPAPLETAAASSAPAGMVAVIFSRVWKFSPNGYDVETYDAGPGFCSPRCAETARQAGALVEPGE